MLVIGVPAAAGGVNQTFVANARTGAWCRFTGWDVRCGAVSSDYLFFGGSDGIVYRGYNGGTDAGDQYTGTYIPKAQGDADGRLKLANKAEILARVVNSFTVTAKGFADHNTTEITAPDPLHEPSGPTWGTSVWGAFVWGGATARVTKSRWKTIRAKGYAIAPGFSVTSNQDSAPVFEIISARIRYESGAPM
jgi:hypothetical protein